MGDLIVVHYDEGLFTYFYVTTNDPIGMIVSESNNHNMRISELYYKDIKKITRINLEEKTFEEI